MSRLEYSDIMSRIEYRDIMSRVEDMGKMSRIEKHLPPLSKVSYKNPCHNNATTSIIKGYVWKPPDVSKSYSKPKRGKEKFNMAPPGLTLFHHLRLKTIFLF